MIIDDNLNGLTHEIIGAAMEVYNHLGAGFLEQIYQKSMEHELALRSLDYYAQHPVKVKYKNILVGDYYPDFIVANKVIVELKALSLINYGQVQQQVINYLVATGIKVGLMINFGNQPLEFKRYLIPSKFQ